MPYFGYRRGGYYGRLLGSHAIAASGDITAPTLTNATGATATATTASLSVDTDEGNGTLYWYVSTSATPPSAADLKAGTGAAYAANEAVASTGTKTETATGLSELTTYYLHALHTDAAANDSAIVTSASWDQQIDPVTPSVDSLRHLGEELAKLADSSGVQDGQALTVNGQAVGSYHYRIIDGNHTISAFSNNDYFSTVEDSDWEVLVVDGDLTINSGQTVQPTARKLGLVVYVTGDLAVSGGISMTARGANHSAATGSNIAAAAVRIADGTYGGDLTDPEIPAAGGAGGAGSSGGGNTGSNGSGGGTGGGGSGREITTTFSSGAGSAGTSFSGGCGSGGLREPTQNGDDAGIDGGAGGAAVSNLTNSRCGGGSGNPGGAGAEGGGAGGTGTGGILVVICLGAFSGAGTVTANGVIGGLGDNSSGGGASGGGSITVLYGSDSSSITPTANGGGAASIGGAAGGAGTARKKSIP